jgi:hypothetical protein
MKMSDDDRPLSIKEFCVKVGICTASYYKMRKAGYGPEETYLPGLQKKWIFPQAIDNWYQLGRQFNIKNAKKLEALRRRKAENARAAAAKSIASPNHVSKWPKNKGRPRGRPRKTSV